MRATKSLGIGVLVAVMAIASNAARANNEKTTEALAFDQLKTLVGEWVGKNGTKVTYTADLQVGGTIASVGQRMIQGTAKMMATQFFTSLAAEAKTAVGEPPPQHGFFRTALRWFSGLATRAIHRLRRFNKK